jgi:hypothetical protein
MQLDAETSGTERHDLRLIEAGPHPRAVPTGRRVGLYHVGLEVGSRDTTYRLSPPGSPPDPHLTLILGGVDSGFVHSLYVADPEANEVGL